jgi:hypothetical protein
LLWINVHLSQTANGGRDTYRRSASMNAGQIARAHFAAAMNAAKAEGQDPDAVARTLLAEVVTSMLQRRSLADVRAELVAAADNVDPDKEYMFMRP